LARQQSDNLDAAVVLIKASHKAVVLAHINPDGDTLGSALGLALGLRQLGKEAEVFCADTLPENLAFLPAYGEIRTQGPLPPDVDLVVLVDASDISRFGTLSQGSEGFCARAACLNVDHHTTNGRFAAVNLVDPTAAATGEQIFALLGALGVDIDPAIATCLLTAVVTDTRGFRTASTTPRTLAIAAQLHAKGAPLADIVQSVYYNRPFTTLRLWGLALERLRCRDGVAWTEITLAMQAQVGATPSEGDGVIDLMASLRQVTAVALFRETPEGIKVSLRSTDGFDVSAVAARFGGGGHPRAAGCFIPGGLAAAEDKVLQYLAERAAAP